MSNSYIQFRALFYGKLSVNSLVVRKICEDDCCQEFTTGEPKFDLDEHGNLIPLSFYLYRDRSGQYQSFVYEENGEVIGVLCVEITENTLYLSRIGIKSTYRNQHKGYFLHKYMMDLVQEKRIKVISAMAHYGVFGWFRDLGYLKVHEYGDPLWGKSALMLLLIG